MCTGSKRRCPRITRSAPWCALPPAHGTGTCPAPHIPVCRASSMGMKDVSENVEPQGRAPCQEGAPSQGCSALSVAPHTLPLTLRSDRETAVTAPPLSHISSVWTQGSERPTLVPFQGAQVQSVRSDQALPASSMQEGRLCLFTQEHLSHSSFPAPSAPGTDVTCYRTRSS